MTQSTCTPWLSPFPRPLAQADIHQELLYRDLCSIKVCLLNMLTYNGQSGESEATLLKKGNIDVLTMSFLMACAALGESCPSLPTPPPVLMHLMPGSIPKRRDFCPHSELSHSMDTVGAFKELQSQSYVLTASKSGMCSPASSALPHITVHQPCVATSLLEDRARNFDVAGLYI